MTIEHWSPPDIRGDILAAAWRSDAAAPATIHVRPEVHARICPCPLPPDGTAGDGPDSTGLPPGVCLVVDADLPRTPGYEVHRVAPVEPTCEHRVLRPVDDAAGPGTSVPVPCAGTSRGGHRRGPLARELRWLLAHRRHPGADGPRRRS